MSLLRWQTVSLLYQANKLSGVFQCLNAEVALYHAASKGTPLVVC
jgi:hypothetical protein